MKNITKSKPKTLTAVSTKRARSLAKAARQVLGMKKEKEVKPKANPHFELVDTSNMMNTSILVKDANFASLLNGWNSLVVDWHAVSRIRGNGKPFTVHVSSFLGAYNFDELKSYNTDLFKAIDAIREARKEAIRKMIMDNTPFGLGVLPEVLQDYTDKQIFVTMDGRLTCATLKEARYDMGFFGASVTLTLGQFNWKEGKVFEGTTKFVIRDNGNARTLANYGIILKPTEAQLAEATERGKRILHVLNNCSYVRLEGNLTYKQGWYTRVAPAEGRAVVDPTGYELFNPDTDLIGFEYDEDRMEAIDLATMSEDNLRCLNPHIIAFSFPLKLWGRVHIDQVKDIAFREDAFEKLVMPDADKRMVMSLVRNSDTSIVSDVVDGKGGGCVLLLHGKPGLGKTLCSETVAEELKRPLYAVAVGELGVNPDDLEKRLTTVLRTAQRWNAVLLLDEADVFLEARRAGDIQRNAMVGTFLRLLEYYNGILILTTNRVKDMDTAFYSRISLALEYQDFDITRRQQVIRNLLTTNGVTLTDSEIHRIAMLEVNGRQIKNSIRLSRFLAKDENRSVKADDIMEILQRLNTFQESFRSEN